MRLLVLSIGKLRDPPIEALIQRYRTRTAFDLIEFQAQGSLPVPVRVAAEAALLLAAVPPGARVVALDERGPPLTSPAFAARLGSWRDQAVPCAAFLIGGADGHDEAVRARADLVLGFGPMTWPHALARVLLAEQLWRAASILSGHPYHRG